MGAHRNRKRYQEPVRTIFAIITQPLPTLTLVSAQGGMKSGDVKRQQYIRVEKLAITMKEMLARFVQDQEGFKVRYSNKSHSIWSLA
jgi:hypothetical protein